jgi:hypothetical protein
MQSDYRVAVPVSPINLREENLCQIEQIANSIGQAGDEDGVVRFLGILNYLQQLAYQ